MTVEGLPFGRILSGLLDDGVNHNSYVGSVLRMEEPGGAVVDVPFIHSASTGQYLPVQQWFSTRTPPRNMVLKTADGDVSLFEIEWSGHSIKTGRSVSLGKLRPTELVLASRTSPLDQPLLVSEARSHVDGLREWSGFSAIDYETARGENGLVKKVTIEVQSLASVSWSQGEATMTIQTDWRTSDPQAADDPSLGIFDWVVLDSRFEKPASFFDHLVEHRKVVHLLVFLFDAPIHFRRHLVRDECFSTLSGDGKSTYQPFVELLSRRTVKEYAEAQPSKADLARPLLRLRNVGGPGLSRWAVEYKKWERFILPAVAVLGRREVFVEDLVVSLSMSLEAGGKLLGSREGESATYWRGKPTTATNVYRCLHWVDVNWGDHVASIAALATAAARIYNSIKHFDGKAYPDSEKTHLVSLVLRQAVRLMALKILDETGDEIRVFREEGSLWRIHQSFSDYELRIIEDGQWEIATRPSDCALPDGLTSQP